MVEKRKTPWWAFILALIILMILSYFGCGLLKLDGVSVKESRGQPKSGALKQATCKGNF